VPLEELSYNLRIRIISVENFEMFFGQYSNTVVTDTPFTYSVALRVYGPRSRAHPRSLAIGAPSHVIVNSYVGDRELRRAHTGNLEFLRWDEWVEFDNMPINRVRTLHGSFACKLLLTLVVLRARLSSCSCHAIRASVCLSTSRAKANLASSVG